MNFVKTFNTTLLFKYLVPLIKQLKNDNWIDTSNYPKGLYFIKIFGEKSTTGMYKKNCYQSQKFIKRNQLCKKKHQIVNLLFFHVIKGQ